LPARHWSDPGRNPFNPNGSEDEKRVSARHQVKRLDRTSKERSRYQKPVLQKKQAFFVRCGSFSEVRSFTSGCLLSVESGPDVFADALVPPPGGWCPVFSPKIVGLVGAGLPASRLGPSARALGCPRIGPSLPCRGRLDRKWLGSSVPGRRAPVPPRAVHAWLAFGRRRSTLDAMVIGSPSRTVNQFPERRQKRDETSVSPIPRHSRGCRVYTRFIAMLKLPFKSARS
jgi:hypothetical protein